MRYHTQLIQTVFNPENKSTSQLTLILQKPQKHPRPVLAPGSYKKARAHGEGRVGVTRCGPPQHELPNMNLYPFSANPLHLRWKPPNELSVQCQLETSQCLHGLPCSSQIPSLTIEKLSNGLSRARSQEQPGLQQVIQSPQTAGHLARREQKPPTKARPRRRTHTVNS